MTAKISSNKFIIQSCIIKIFFSIFLHIYYSICIILFITFLSFYQIHPFHLLLNLVFFRNSTQLRKPYIMTSSKYCLRGTRKWTPYFGPSSHFHLTLQFGGLLTRKDNSVKLQYIDNPHQIFDCLNSPVERL